jgi:uncharacterized RDD family membrane protein YckC
VELDDAITISTPEGVELRVVLAGAGSRFIEGTLDLVIQLVLLVLTTVVLAEVVGGGVGAALLAMAAFAIFFLYHVLFEVLGSGRTPGKRMTHLRVVRESGAPVDLPASAIRTLLRLIDFLPTVYLIGLTSIVATRKNQRLGDLAADTLVIRELPAIKQPAATPAAPVQSALSFPTATAVGWDVSAVTPEELAAVQRFLARRNGLDPEARRTLAYRLEQALRSKVAAAPPTPEPEQFLEALARVKSAR